MEALFSSLLGGDALRERVLRTLREAVAAGGSKQVDVHIMTFSFTDVRIAQLLEDLATQHPNATIRIVADWSQGGPEGGRLVQRLVRAGIPNLSVRFKNDQPYEWDDVRERPRWSYAASRGLLHHKTLGILVDGSPQTLVCGSYNWTAKAATSYENLLIVTADDPGSRNLMRSVEWEFEAMWSDGRATLSPAEAREHYWRILEEYRLDPAKPAASVIGLGAGEDVPLLAMVTTDDDPTDAADVVIAFNSRSPHQPASESGYSSHNRGRRFALRKPGGTTKQVPLTLTSVALDMITAAGEGEALKVAMYGMSARVPEYGALLDAARRGVRVQVLLDGFVGAPMLRRLAMARLRENLPIELRAGSRMMHEKYVVHPESQTVLTGTANFSTDASSRHSEQRIVLRSHPVMTARFLADFDTIWSRIPRPFHDGASPEKALDTRVSTE